MKFRDIVNVLQVVLQGIQAQIRIVGDGLEHGGTPAAESVDAVASVQLILDIFFQMTVVFEVPECKFIYQKVFSSLLNVSSRCIPLIVPASLCASEASVSTAVSTENVKFTPPLALIAGVATRIRSFGRVS